MLSETKLDGSKKIVFFTYSPKGTLGNASAAAKLINNMKEKYGASLDITAVLMTDRNKEMTDRLFEGIRLFSRDKGDPFYSEDTTELSRIFNESDGIIFFPIFFIKEERQRQTIFNKIKDQQKIFIVTEYDYVDDSLSNLSKEFKLPYVQMHSGLAETNLGIFCTQETKASNNHNALSEIKDADKACRDLLLQGTKNKALFFGYYRATSGDASESVVNLRVFVQSCLGLVSPEIEAIDFVLPLQSHISGVSANYDINTIFSDCLTLGYQIEFWKKDSEGRMICLKSSEGSGKKIRFIDGFPFAPDTMSKL